MGVIFPFLSTSELLWGLSNIIIWKPFKKYKRLETLSILIMVLSCMANHFWSPCTGGLGSAVMLVCLFHIWKKFDKSQPCYPNWTKEMIGSPSGNAETGSWSQVFWWCLGCNLQTPPWLSETKWNSLKGRTEYLGWDKAGTNTAPKTDGARTKWQTEAAVLTSQRHSLSRHLVSQLTLKVLYSLIGSAGFACPHLV